ncbi:hypothetical protein HJD18_07060 [Thermoleophilia bacterium SCSIO 60948]|nr:hypothetical protein HJD18_07060 [Thermoleophilia bacterium SCSIO 60948]
MPAPPSRATTRRPDFFLVGAPKCGTTAMDDYLRSHPEIGMCDRKETQFLAGEQMWRRFGTAGEPEITEARYLEMFADAQGFGRIGESSVWYLYSREAPSRIHRFSPDAQIVVMLRNPLEMLPSLHSQFVYVGLEPEPDFDRALALDPAREAGERPPGFPPDSYLSAARYDEQIARYLDEFGAERVLLVTYDEFRADTAAAYRRVLEFLRVDPSFTPSFEVVNANKRVRSSALRTAVRNPPPALRRALHAVSTQRMRRRTALVLHRVNSQQVDRAALSDGAREMIRPLVAEQVERLRALCGLELDAWLA